MFCNVIPPEEAFDYGQPDPALDRMPPDPPPRTSVPRNWIVAFSYLSAVFVLFIAYTVMILAAILIDLVRPTLDSMSTKLGLMVKQFRRRNNPWLK